MMTFVEHVARRGTGIVATAEPGQGGLIHHQGVVGDDDVGALARRTLFSMKHL